MYSRSVASLLSKGRALPGRTAVRNFSENIDKNRTRKFINPGDVDPHPKHPGKGAGYVLVSVAVACAFVGIPYYKAMKPYWDAGM